MMLAIVKNTLDFENNEDCTEHYEIYFISVPPMDNAVFCYSMRRKGDDLEKHTEASSIEKMGRSNNRNKSVSDACFVRHRMRASRPNRWWQLVKCRSLLGVTAISHEQNDWICIWIEGESERGGSQRGRH